MNQQDIATVVICSVPNPNTGKQLTGLIFEELELTVPYKRIEVLDPIHFYRRYVIVKHIQVAPASVEMVYSSFAGLTFDEIKKNILKFRSFSSNRSRGLKRYTDIDDKTICRRCEGTGFIPQFSHFDNGICFNCRGIGVDYSLVLKAVAKQNVSDEYSADYPELHTLFMCAEQGLPDPECRWLEANAVSQEEYMGQ